MNHDWEFVILPDFTGNTGFQVDISSCKQAEFTLLSLERDFNSPDYVDKHIVKSELYELK